ncbi:ABC-F family ATP-binding cassette domain-containing protein [Phytomonospora endophytica]|uniref:ATPase subunit of ABC transporter with duplicated ATPase domains n=1 Tax=Phytomonospora endophytica TaxID=714109 RepID=A0A841G1R5_9ACTN|nr:ABC-F family ATP-binding cassette domain-containing protein [Phytomonospora endophytica]MBB6039702.1 ATPase subunit of ABC transporter with duplicated ATPase domains [Phytomonospora endophytica]GIG70961.1 ABC transporter ATP-binding protein [Phytomonospora endophytica]
MANTGNLINLDTVAKSYGTTTLFGDLSTGVNTGDRIGVVGLNGTGKTTLLRLIAKTEEPDAGRITHRRDLRVGMLPQTIEYPAGATITDVVLGDAWLPTEHTAEHHWAGDAAIRNILDGLGMHNLGLDSSTDTMSGGERRRVALAALLTRPVDVLILDEPTNHLDITGINWLAGWLTANARTLIAVTHDRWFLDAVCDTTWEVTDQTINSYEGGYSSWILARAERDRQAAATEERRRNLVRKELAWLRRGAPARTSKPKFRIAAADALIADVPDPRDTLTLARLATTRLGRRGYELADVSVEFGGRAIFEHVDWHAGPGDRIGLVGANGAGKSTLFRLLTGTQQPTGGTVETGATVKPAMLSQELHELPGDLRLLEAVQEKGNRFTLGDRDISAGQLAEIFGFTDKHLWTHVRDLSGGQRRRLQLLRLLAEQPNALLLDEPTNDLDIDTLQALEDLLDSWTGILIVASHDRYLLERVTDKTVALLGDGTLKELPGGVDQYLELVEGKPADGGGPATTAKGTGAPNTYKVNREAQKELKRLERQLDKLSSKETALHEKLAAAATDHQRLTELHAELNALLAEKEDVETRWLELADAEG